MVCLSLFSLKFGQSESEVCYMIRTCFQSGSLPLTFNHTLLALIPKLTNITVMNHIRPKSFRNTLYKVVAKLIVSNSVHSLKSWCIQPKLATLKDEMYLTTLSLPRKFSTNSHKPKGPKVTLLGRLISQKRTTTLIGNTLKECYMKLAFPERY